MQNEPLIPENLLQNEEHFSDPYQAIADFFDSYDLASHRMYIATWMEAVNKNGHWQEESPAELIYYYQNLIQLIRAADEIRQAGGKRKTATDLLKEKGYPVSANLLHPALYVGWVREHTLWHYFPRSLSREEYNDPYLVLTDFFSVYSADEWRHELYELLSDGLSDSDPAEYSIQERNMLKIGTSLLKLVEAAQLIDVRETEYVGDFKKRNPYTLDTPCEKISLLSLLCMKTREWPEDDEEEEEEEDDGENSREEEEEEEEEEIEPEDLAAELQGAGSIELSIEGIYLVGGRRIALEPVKIEIPVKTAE